MVFPSSPAEEQRTAGFAWMVTLHHSNSHRVIRALKLLESAGSWLDPQTLGPSSRPAGAETAFQQDPGRFLGTLESGTHCSPKVRGKSGR